MKKSKVNNDNVGCADFVGSCLIILVVYSLVCRKMGGKQLEYNMTCENHSDEQINLELISENIPIKVTFANFSLLKVRIIPKFAIFDLGNFPIFYNYPRIFSD